MQLVRAVDKNHRRYISILILLSTIFCITFFYLKILQYKSFFSFEWEDDAQENQLVYNIATTFSPYQTIRNSQPPSRIFNDHFTPIHFLIAIFYRIYPHMYAWYFLVCFTYGFSALIIYLLAKVILEDGRAAVIIALIYLLYPPLHYATLGAYEARNFFLPLFLLTFYYSYTRNFIPYLFFMVLSCLCKEDVPVYIFMLGIYQLFKKYPKKWWGSTLLFSSLYFILAAYLSSSFCRMLIEADAIKYINWDNFKKIVMLVMLDGRGAVSDIFYWYKIRFFVMHLYPILFLSMLSIEFYMWIPVLLLELGLADGFFNQNSDYVAYMAPFVFISLIFTLKKIRTYWGERGVFFVVLLILAVCLASNGGRNIIGCIPEESPVFSDPYADEYDTRFRDVKNIFDRRLYVVEEDDRVAWKLIKMIPSNASVMVTADLLPAMSSRMYVYEFGLNHPKAFEGEFGLITYPNYDVDYILINKICLVNGMGGHYPWLKREDLEEEIKKLLYEWNFIIKQEEGTFLLLERQYVAG